MTDFIICIMSERREQPRKVRFIILFTLYQIVSYLDSCTVTIICTTKSSNFVCSFSSKIGIFLFCVSVISAPFSIFLLSGDSYGSETGVELLMTSDERYHSSHDESDDETTHTLLPGIQMYCGCCT